MSVFENEGNVSQDANFRAHLDSNWDSGNREFDKVEGSIESHNKRYRWIVKHGDNIYNNTAYKVTIRKTYNHNLGIESKCDIPPINFNPVLYISKGGIITGEYICQCQIRPDIVNKHSFVIQSIINIPASAIVVNNRHVCVVDHREPKLKTLKEFYDVPINFDEEIKNLKLNIRKYKKL